VDLRIEIASLSRWHTRFAFPRLGLRWRGTQKQHQQQSANYGEAEDHESVDVGAHIGLIGWNHQNLLEWIKF
jgi:hypothetical protein